MKTLSIFCLVAHTIAGVGAAGCRKDACYSQVAVQRQNSPPLASRRADCSAILKKYIDDTGPQTLLPSTIGTSITTTTLYLEATTVNTLTKTVSSTVTVSTTVPGTQTITTQTTATSVTTTTGTSTITYNKRDQIVVSGTKPAYASSCVNVQSYATACLCAGIKANQVSTITKTVYIPTTASRTSTATSTSTVSQTTTKTSISSQTSSVTYLDSTTTVIQSSTQTSTQVVNPALITTIVSTRSGRFAITKFSRYIVLDTIPDADASQVLLPAPFTEPRLADNTNQILYLDPSPGIITAPGPLGEVYFGPLRGDDSTSYPHLLCIASADSQELLCRRTVDTLTGQFAECGSSSRLSFFWAGQALTQGCLATTLRITLKL